MQEAVNLQMEAMGASNSSGQENTVVDDGARGGDISSEQVNSVVDVSGGTSSGRGIVSIVVERTILPGIGDVLLEVESVISVKRLGSSGSSVVKSLLRQRQSDHWCDWRNTSSVNARGRKTDTNYVDSDTESGQTSTPNYVFSVGERLGQRVE